MLPPSTYAYVHNIADGFNVDNMDSFINTHLDKYDMVFMPDCGGPWFTALQSVDPPAELANIINNVMKIIKKGGWLFIGKLIGNEINTLNRLKIKYGFKNLNIELYDYYSERRKYIRVIK
jgi:hypothetical protein